MFKLSIFRDDAYYNAIDISNNHYLDNGMDLIGLSRNTGIDIATLMTYDDWYILDDGFYYFKSMYKIEELFISELARECKVRCVEFLLAIDNSRFGIISKLYREKDKEYYMYDSFCHKFFENSPDSLGAFRLASSIAFGEDKMQKLMKDVFDLICLDMFTGQWDREEYNLFFECDSDNNVRIAPLCDNGLVFDNSFIYDSPFGKFNLKSEIVKRGNLPFILSVDMDFYNKLAMYLDINVSEVLDRTCEKYKIEIDESEKERVLTYFDTRKSAIEHTLRLSRNNK